MTDISFMTDTISIYRKKPIFETPIRYDTDNIGIADIDTIDPSLNWYFRLYPAHYIDCYRKGFGSKSFYGPDALTVTQQTASKH